MGSINIINYKDIIDFSDNKVIIDGTNINIIISGKSLVISKLLDEEVLITGDISKIEFR